jgi:hypothetical protein
MSSSLSTPQHSEIGLPLSISSSPSLRDAGCDDSTTPTGRTGLALPPSRKSIKDQRDHKRGWGRLEIFLLALTVILVLPTMIAIKVITASISSNNNNTMLFRENLDGRDSSSLLFTQQRRFLQNATVNDAERLAEIAITVPAGVSKDDANFDEVIAELITTNSTDESDEYSANNETATETPTLPIIAVELPAGVSENDKNIAEVIDELIPTNTTAEDDSPITNNNNGSPDTNDGEANMTMVPSLSPLATVVPQPTSFPIGSPTATNEPSVAPSPSPSISPKPSGFPSDAPTPSPTVSPGPSAVPSVSFEPTVSFAPTLEPTNTFTVKTTFIDQNVVMILENLPSLLQNDTIGIWENVTSQHLLDYHKTLSDTYPNNWPLQITGVRTIFQSQTIPPEKEADDSKNKADEEDLVPASRQDGPMDPPPNTFTEIPGTLKVEIVYDQWVTYETYEGNITDDELRNRLFIQPYTTDSLHYSMDLVVAMKWSNWVIVDIVEDIEEEAQQTPQPIAEPIASRLNLAQTFAISASIVTAACLIVLFLFWERNKKLDVNAATNDQREEDYSTINSAMQWMQGTPARSSSEVEHAGLPWNSAYYNPNNNKSNTTAADETIISSAQSTPGHLRRDSDERIRLGFKDSMEGRHLRVGSKDSMEGRHLRMGSTDTAPLPSNGIYGTEKSGHSKSSSSSSNIANSPKRYPIEVNYGSPGTPQRVPAAIRGTIANSSTNRSSSNRPYLPPLPPSSFGSNTHDRRRNVDDQFLNSTNLTVPRNDYSHSSSNNDNNTTSNSSFTRPAPTAFRQPSRGFGMQVSAVSDDNLTDLSFLTDAFTADRQYSTEFLMQNPQHSEASIRSRLETIKSQPEPFTSPLHIPDEEGILSVGPRTSAEIHLSTMPTMLGLESRPIDDAL